jgi:hypothetical protein
MERKMKHEVELVTHSPAPKNDGRYIEIVKGNASIFLNDKEAMKLGAMLIRAARF